MSLLNAAMNGGASTSSSSGFEVGDIKPSARKFNLGDEWALADGTLSITTADHPDLLNALQAYYASGEQYDLSEYDADRSVFTPFPELTSAPVVEPTALLARYQLMYMYTGNTSNGAAMFFGGLDFKNFNAVPAFESTAQHSASSYQWYDFTPLDARYAAALFTRNEGYFNDTNNSVRQLSIGVFDSITGEICAENTQLLYDYRSTFVVPLTYHQDEKWYYFVVTTSNSSYNHASGSSSLVLYRFNLSTQELELVLDGQSDPNGFLRYLMYKYSGSSFSSSFFSPGSVNIIPLGNDEYYLCGSYARLKLSRQAVGQWQVDDFWNWSTLLSNYGSSGDGQANPDYNASTGIYTVVRTRRGSENDYVTSIDMANKTATEVVMGVPSHSGQISGDRARYKSFRLSGLERLGGRYYLFTGNNERKQVAIHDADEDAETWPVWYENAQTSANYTTAKVRSALITALQGDIDVCQAVHTLDRDALSAQTNHTSAPWHLLKRQSGETKVLSDLEYDSSARTLTVTTTTLPPTGGGSYVDQVSVINLSPEAPEIDTSYVGRTFGVDTYANNFRMTSYLGAEDGREAVFFEVLSGTGEYEIAYIFSRDGGVTWSQPERVFNQALWSASSSRAGYILNPIDGLIIASDETSGLRYYDANARTFDPSHPQNAAAVRGPVFRELNYAGKYISIPKIDNHLIKVK